MKAYFVQLVNDNFYLEQRVTLSGAVLAEDKIEAEKKAIEIAKTYRVVKEMGLKMCLYTLIELTDEIAAQFSVEIEFNT